VSGGAITETGAIERFARKLQLALTKGRAFDCLITGDAELRRPEPLPARV